MKLTKIQETGNLAWWFVERQVTSMNGKWGNSVLVLIQTYSCVAGKVWDSGPFLAVLPVILTPDTEPQPSRNQPCIGRKGH